MGQFFLIVNAEQAAVAVYGRSQSDAAIEMLDDAADFERATLDALFDGEERGAVAIPDRTDLGQWGMRVPWVVEMPGTAQEVMCDEDLFADVLDALMDAHEARGPVPSTEGPARNNFQVTLTAEQRGRLDTRTVG